MTSTWIVGLDLVKPLIKSLSIVSSPPVFQVLQRRRTGCCCGTGVSAGAIVGATDALAVVGVAVVEVLPAP
jgi:hypothetical protein